MSHISSTIIMLNDLRVNEILYGIAEKAEFRATPPGFAATPVQAMHESVIRGIASLFSANPSFGASAYNGKMINGPLTSFKKALNKNSNKPPDELNGVITMGEYKLRWAINNYILGNKDAVASISLSHNNSFAPLINHVCPKKEKAAELSREISDSCRLSFTIGGGLILEQINPTLSTDMSWTGQNRKKESSVFKTSWLYWDEFCKYVVDNNLHDELKKSFSESVVTTMNKILADYSPKKEALAKQTDSNNPQSVDTSAANAQPVKSGMSISAYNRYIQQIIEDAYGVDLPYPVTQTIDCQRDYRGTILQLEVKFSSNYYNHNDSASQSCHIKLFIKSPESKDMEEITTYNVKSMASIHNNSAEARLIRDITAEDLIDFDTFCSNNISEFMEHMTTRDEAVLDMLKDNYPVEAMQFHLCQDQNIIAGATPGV